MEKISSIVPKSRRVSSVDLQAAPAVRPGAPAFGRPVGISTSGFKSELTTAQRAVAEFGHMNDVRRGSGANVAIVEKMANDFFLKKATEAPINVESDIVPIEQQLGAIAKEDETQYSTQPAAPDEYVPPGTYLNIEA